MRSVQRAFTILAGLGLVAGSAGTAAATPEPVENPIQIQIRMDDTWVSGRNLSEKADEAVAELRARGLVTGEKADALRVLTAAAVTTRKNSAQGELAIKTLHGVPAQIKVGAIRKPHLEATFTPRAVDGKIELTYRFIYDGAVKDRNDKQTIERTVTVPDGERLAILLPGADASADHIYWVRLSTLNNP